jgi:N-acetylmuramoyl-L-alanine amidase
LLLAAATDLTPAQKTEVARLAPGGAYLVGAATRLSDKVEASLAAAGATDTQRVTGSDSTDTARRIAALLDTRDAEARARGVPAFEAAVVVNSQTGDAATGSALAAALRMPVLFTQRDAVPPATSQALAELGIKTTLVVGGPTSVGDAVLGDLPGARRLGGDNPTVTSEAVAAEARARNVATNVVYVSDGERPSDQAAIGAAVATLGGIMLAEPTADPAAARRSLDSLAITPVVDRLVSVRSDTSGASTGVRTALAVVILLIGIATLVVALAHRDGDSERGSPAPTMLGARFVASYDALADAPEGSGDENDTRPR